MKCPALAFSQVEKLLYQIYNCKTLNTSQFFMPIDFFLLFSILVCFTYNICNVPVSLGLRYASIHSRHDKQNSFILHVVSLFLFLIHNKKLLVQVRPMNLALLLMLWVLLL